MLKIRQNSTQRYKDFISAKLEEVLGKVNIKFSGEYFMPYQTIYPQEGAKGIGLLMEVNLWPNYNLVYPSDVKGWGGCNPSPKVFLRFCRGDFLCKSVHFSSCTCLFILRHLF